MHKKHRPRHNDTNKSGFMCYAIKNVFGGAKRKLNEI